MTTDERVEAARKGFRLARATAHQTNNVVAQLYTMVMSALDGGDENAFLQNLRSFHTMTLEARRNAGDVVEGLNAAIVAMADLLGPQSNDQVH